jgi:hypothetical protein
MTLASAKPVILERSAKGSMKLASVEKWRAVKSYVETTMPTAPMRVCVDLDSVLLHHDPEDGACHLGLPLPLGRALVKLLKSRGYEVIVLTSRLTEVGHNARPMTKLRILRYLRQLDFPVDDVTNIKPYAAAYFDDKAYRVQKNWE